MPLTLRLQRLRVGTIARTKNVDSVVEEGAYLTFWDFVEPTVAEETIMSKTSGALRRRMKAKRPFKPYSKAKSYRASTRRCGSKDKRWYSYCGNKGHLISDCSKKKNGEPSRDEVREGVKLLHERKAAASDGSIHVLEG